VYFLFCKGLFEKNIYLGNVVVSMRR